MKTIGTCSSCGGPVQLPSTWSGSKPPIPQCGRCGAQAKNPYGEVIETEKKDPTQYRTNRNALEEILGDKLKK